MMRVNDILVYFIVVVLVILSVSVASKAYRQYKLMDYTVKYSIYIAGSRFYTKFNTVKKHYDRKEKIYYIYIKSKLHDVYKTIEIYTDKIQSDGDLYMFAYADWDGN